MRADSGVELSELKVDGGMVGNELLMQFQADQLGVPVVRPPVTETTALGAAYAAGLAVGYWSGLDDLRRNWAEGARWAPTMPGDERERLYAQWKKAVTRTFDWADDPPSGPDAAARRRLGQRHVRGPGDERGILRRAGPARHGPAHTVEPAVELGRLQAGDLGQRHGGPNSDPWP